MTALLDVGEPVAFAVQDAEAVAVVGHDGAGKTAVGEVVAGLRPGAVRFAGRAVSGPGEGGLAYVPEGRRIFPSLTVAENLALGAYRDRRDRALVAERRDRVHALFPLLAERRGQTAATLSGGEQQLLVIARALMSAPRLLVLDEPSAGLGPRAVAQVAAALEAVKATGTALLLLDQALQLPRAVADRILLLEEGRIALDAPRDVALRDARLGVGYVSSPPGG